MACYILIILGLTVNIFIAPLSYTLMFYTNYLTMHKVHLHAGAIRQLLYGCVYVREIIHSLKLVDYPFVHTRKPYNNLRKIYYKKEEETRNYFWKMFTITDR